MGYEEYKKKIMPLCPVAITRAYLVAIEAHSQLGRPRVCEAVEQLLRPP